MQATPFLFAAVLVSLGTFSDVREGAEYIAPKSPVVGNVQGIRAIQPGHYRSTDALGPGIVMGKAGTGESHLSDSDTTTRISDNATAIDRTNNSAASPSRYPWAGQKVLLVLGLKLVPILTVLLFVAVLHRWRNRRKPRPNGSRRSRRPGNVRED